MPSKRLSAFVAQQELKPLHLFKTDMTPRTPEPSPAFDGLIAGFVQRGARLGQGQGELSPYGRWVLTTFGPEILEAFGSFDLLATDLVPMSLIRESLGERRARKVPDRDDIPFQG